VENPHSDFFWPIGLLACTDHFSRLTPVRREAPYPEVTGRGRGETPTECEIRHVIERQGERQGEHWGGKSVENPHSDFFWPIRLLACTDHFSRLTPVRREAPYPEVTGRGRGSPPTECEASSKRASCGVEAPVGELPHTGDGSHERLSAPPTLHESALNGA
jgi:hypothetical protein